MARDGDGAQSGSGDDPDLDPACEADFERWMRSAGAAAYEHAKAHPELAMTAEEARARLAGARAKRRGDDPEPRN